MSSHALALLQAAFGAQTLVGNGDGQPDSGSSSEVEEVKFESSGEGTTSEEEVVHFPDVIVISESEEEGEMGAGAGEEEGEMGAGAGDASWKKLQDSLGKVRKHAEGYAELDTWPLEWENEQSRKICEELNVNITPDDQYQYFSKLKDFIEARLEKMGIHVPKIDELDELKNIEKLLEMTNEIITSKYKSLQEKKEGIFTTTLRDLLKLETYGDNANLTMKYKSTRENLFKKGIYVPDNDAPTMRDYVDLQVRLKGNDPSSGAPSPKPLKLHPEPLEESFEDYDPTWFMERDIEKLFKICKELHVEVNIGHVDRMGDIYQAYVSALRDFIEDRLTKFHILSNFHIEIEHPIDDLKTIEEILETKSEQIEKTYSWLKMQVKIIFRDFEETITLKRLLKLEAQLSKNPSQNGPPPAKRLRPKSPEGKAGLETCEHCGREWDGYTQCSCDQSYEHAEKIREKYLELKRKIKKMQEEISKYYIIDDNPNPTQGDVEDLEKLLKEIIATTYFRGDEGGYEGGGESQPETGQRIMYVV